MKAKTFIWIITLLLIINISAIVTMLYHKKQEKQSEGVSNSYVEAMQSQPSMQYSGRWFRDELQLTREQMAEFSQFNPVFRQKVRSINFDLADKRQQMLDELAAEKSDTTLLNGLSDSIGALHSELKKATYAYYLEFKRICTPDQQEKLHDIFNNMFEGEMPAGGRRGMQGGRRFGMRWKNEINN